MDSICFIKIAVSENSKLVNSKRNIQPSCDILKSTEFHNSFRRSRRINRHSSFPSYAFQPFPPVGTNCGHGGTGRISLAGALIVGTFVKTSIAKIINRN